MKYKEINSAVTYAIGDLHGEVTLLKKLLAVLPFRDEDTLVFLGDYMDRGEDSLATILALQELQRIHARCIFLRGNHDDEWLAQWDGAAFQQAPNIEGALDVWQSGRLPYTIGYWLERTQIEYEDEYAYYVHAGVLPEKPVSHTPDLYKMWGAHGFLESDYDWDKPVGFGHHSLPEPLLEHNKIGIDTGAYKSGILTAVRLPGRQIFQARR